MKSFQRLLQYGANGNRGHREMELVSNNYNDHIQHQQHMRMMTNPYAKDGGQTSLHMAVQSNDLTRATLLLEKHINPNVRNSEGLTALHMAAMKDQRPMVELILAKSKYTPDLDSYRDTNGETTRDVLTKKMPDLLLPLGRHPDVMDLPFHLFANDETNFLHCLRAIPNNVPIKDITNLIKLAVEKNFKNAVVELLERRTASCNLEEAANRAIEYGLVHILLLIMNNLDKADPDPVNRMLLNACSYRFSKGCHKGRLECLRLILARQDVDVHYTDKDGCSALHYAARANNHEAAMMLLQKGHYIGHTNDVGEPVVSFLSPSTLSQFFDDCIQPFETGHIYMKEKYTSFDHTCLFPPSTSQQQESNRQMDAIKHIAGNARLKHLLKHPLLSSFIYLKWRRIRTLRYVNFVLYLLHYAPLWAYMKYITFTEPPPKSSPDSPYKGSTYASAITESTPKPSEEPLKEPSNDIITLQIVISVFLTVFLFWKLFHLIAHTYYYCSKVCTWRSLNLRKCISCFRNELQYGNLCQYVTNWAEVVLEIVGYCVLWAALPRWIYAMLILPHSWLLMVSFGNYVTLFIDMAMYKKVSCKFLRFLFLYGMLIFPFVDVLFILLKTDTSNTDSVLFDTYPFLRLVFVVFVFMIVIVFFNLLVGLAVSDTAEIIGQSELVGLSSMVKLISHIDTTATSISYDLVPNYWPFKLFVVLVKRVLLSDTGILVRYDDSIMKSIGIEKVREIISKRGQESDTDRIIEKVALLDDKLSSLDDKLNTLIDLRDSRSEPGPSGV